MTCDGNAHHFNFEDPDLVATYCTCGLVVTCYSDRTNGQILALGIIIGENEE